MSTAPWFLYDRARTLYGGVEVVPPHEATWRAGERLHREQGEMRRARADGGLFLYYGSARHGLRGSPLAEMVWPTDPPFRNVVGKCVDTKTAHVFRNQVRAYWLTEGGTGADREKAEGMTRLTEAMFEASGLYGYPGFLICQDGQLFDGAVIKTVADVANARVLNERCFPWEIYIPMEESRSGGGRQFFHRQLVDRSVLAGMFPEYEQEIEDAPSAPDDWLLLDGDNDQTSDLVCVWEAWHLPSTRLDLKNDAVWGRDKNGKFRSDVNTGHDGRHVICLEKATLLDRPWVYDHPPLARYLPQPDPLGAWSLSLPETLGGIQLELIKLGKRMQSLIHLHAVPLLAVSRGAKVNLQKLTNDHARIIETNGSPGSAIQYLTPQAVPNELFQRENELERIAMERAGIPDMMASGTKPPGIDHAPGMQHLADEASVRHTPAHRAWERMHVQCGINCMDAAREIAEHNPDFSALYGGEESMERIKIRDVDLGRDRVKFRAWPTNLLPSSPAAKVSNVVFMLQGGLLEDTPAAARGRSLLNFPDTKGTFQNVNQTERAVNAILDKVEAEGMSVETMPEPWDDAKLCQKLAGERIEKLKADEDDEDTIDALRQFAESARRLELRLMAEQTQAGSQQVQAAMVQAPQAPALEQPAA